MKKRIASSDQSNHNAKQQKKTNSSGITTVKETWKYYFDDGRQAYNASQYKEAVDYFTQAIKLQPNNITLLDCRAASWEKLKNWGAAIQDASLMIEIAPTSSKGYLRLGKLLTLQKRYTSALNIYRRGNKKIDKTNDPHYQTILSMEKAMENTIKKQNQYTKKQSDPIKILPYDVLDMIFSQLLFHRRVVCTQVSKHWRQFLHNWSGMWRDLDFITGATKHNAVSRKTLSSYFSYIKGRHIRRFQISTNESKASVALKLLVEHDCQYIEYLGFMDTILPQNQFLRTLRLMGKNLTHLCLDDCNISLEMIFTDIFEVCPHITHLYYANITNPSFITESKKTYKLQYLHLATNVNDSTIDFLFRSCPLLTHIILPNTNIPIDTLFKHSLDDLQVFYYDTQATSAELPYWKKNTYSSYSMMQPKGLKEFIVKRCYALTDHHLISILEKHRTTLQVINLNRSTGFSNAWCSAFTITGGLTSFPLRELQLQYCNKLTESDWISIISNCPQLQIIVACYIEQITNDVLETMSLLSFLEYVDISTCMNVNGIGIRRLVDKRRLTLKKLILNNCTSIGHDAIQYAKSILGDRSVVCTFTQK